MMSVAALEGDETEWGCLYGEKLQGRVQVPCTPFRRRLELVAHGANRVGARVAASPHIGCGIQPGCSVETADLLTHGSLGQGI